MNNDHFPHHLGFDTAISGKKKKKLHIIMWRSSYGTPFPTSAPFQELPFAVKAPLLLSWKYGPNLIQFFLSFFCLIDKGNS